MNAEKSYRVEGHGSSLVMLGGVGRQRLMTREEAWDAAKYLAAVSQDPYHTIKVFRQDVGEVCKLWRQSEGGYMDHKTCKVYFA